MTEDIGILAKYAAGDELPEPVVTYLRKELPIKNWMEIHSVRMANMNIRKIFKSHCGPGAVYLGSEMQQRGEHNTVMVQFEMVPEGRKFSLDGIIHEGDADTELERAVIKIADIAKNIRVHIDPDRPVVMHGN